MNGGSQQTQQSSSTQNTLPSWLTNAYQAALPQATSVFNSGMGATAGMAPGMLSSGMSSIADINPQSIGAADMSLANVLNRGYLGAGQSQMNAANPQIAALASGQYMNPASNPYLQQSYNLGLQGIQNNVDSQFGAAGRNVLAGAPIQADQASNLATQLYGGAYNTNLAAMQNAQQLASGNYNSGVNALNTAAGISPSVTAGLYTPGSTQLSAAMTPFNLTSAYGGLLGQLSAPFGQSNSNSTTTTTMKPSGLSTALGAIGTLAGAATGLGSIGSILGGLGGLGGMEAAPNYGIGGADSSGLGFMVPGLGSGGFL